MNDDQVEIYPAHEDLAVTAQALLDAAGDTPEVVETVHGDKGMGFRLPASVANKAGYDAQPVADPTVEPVAFDPAEHTLPEVRDYLDTADDVERARVLQAEENGKARAGLLG